jgi:hypothetical protein
VVRRDVPEILGPMMSPPQPEIPEARADRFGLILSSLMAFVAALAFAAWIYSGLSFEKCSARASKPERYACYDKLRDQSRTPAKGATAPQPAVTGTAHLTEGQQWSQKFFR